MSTAATDASFTGPPGLIGPDPGLPIRRWVAMVLRLGIGLSLLSIGLSGYFAIQGPMGGPNFRFTNSNFPAIAPLVSALPYLTIGLGLALILGFLTTASSIASACLVLLIPLLLAISIVVSGGSTMFGMGMGGGPDQMITVMMVTAFYLPSLMPLIALIWLSPLENHPVSVDALIFNRVAPEPFSPPVPPAVPLATGDEVKNGR